MKKLLTILLFACPALAQSHRFPTIDLYAGDPTGNSCAPYLIQQSSTTGLLYTCQSGHMAAGGATGSGTVSGQANGVIPLATNSTTVGAQSHMDDGVTTSNVITTTRPINTSATSSVNVGSQTIPAGFKSGIAVFPAFYNPNSAIDVMAAGATGDCVTDDHDAIMRAQAVAGLSTPPLTLKFPRAPGGCFLTSTLTWQGLSQDGEPAGMGNNFSNGSNPIGSKLKSMPGQDLWLFPDWASVTTTIYSQSPKVSHMQWVVDDSVDTSASHPHRKPGRTQVDFVTTAGSRVITSATIQCSGGDVGQGLLLTYPDTTTQSMVATSCTTSTGLWGNGMNGVFGTNLTMASVTPVASTRATVTQGSNVVVVTSATGIANGQVVVMNTLPTNLETTVTNVSGTSITLSNYTQCVNNCSTLTVPIAFYDATAAQATESQTGVTGYLSWGGIPVTETMGVCAFCIDDHDATTAGVPYALLNGSHFEDFNIVTTSNTAVNHSVAIGAQGKAGAFYNANFIHGRISGFAYGIINYPQDTATTNASNGGDQNTFRDLNIGCTHPVTIYNSSYSRIGDIQMSGTGNTGFHLLQSHNVNAEPSNIWEIDISEIEQGLGTINLRIEGYGHTVHRFNASSQGITIWDANASICLTCAPRGTSTGFPSTFLVNGTQNTIPIKDSVNQLIISGDPIGGNRITGLRQTSTAGGMSVWTRPVTFLGRDCVANDRTADFLNGSAAAPFLNMCDLWFWPVDNFPASGVRPILIDDPTSETGMYEKMTVNEILNGTSAWPSGKLIIGSTSGQRANLPAKPVTLNIRVKCPSITSFTLDPAVYTGTSTLVNDFGAKTITCSTTYTTQSITIDLTSYGGGVNWLRLTYGGVTGNEVDEAWIGISPISGPFTATNFTSLSGTNDLTASATKVVTASPGDNTTNAASTAFVTNAVASAAGTACATEWVSTGQAGTRITNGFSNVTNQTRIWSFTPLCSMSFTKITWSIATADNTANLYDIGIYNANGSTLVCHIGATAGTTFAPSTNATVTASTIGTCALTAGTRYILAQTGNASTAILNSSGNTLLGVSAATVTTATTGGVLNSTLTIPADNWAANAFPLFTLHN